MRGGLVIIGLILAGPALGQPAAPPTVVSAIQANVAAAQARAASDEAAFAPLGNVTILEAKRRHNAAEAQASLVALVLEAIPASPQAAAAIVKTATDAAPEHAIAVRNAAAAYFPGYFPAAAAPAPAPARPVAWYDSAPVLRPAAPPVAAAATYVSANTVMPTSWYGQSSLASYGMGTSPPPPPAQRASGPAIDAPSGSGVWDPIEPVNRIFHAFNMVADTFVLRPLAWGYGKVAPDAVKTSVSNALLNLKAPVRLANNLLQGDFSGAGTTVGRFAINSTIGVVGLFDPAASRFNLPARDADFGHTLYGYGLGAGPYLELPALGPTNLRDGIGSGVDIALDPLTWVLNQNAGLARTGVSAVSAREPLIPVTNDLQANSLDYYAALRSATQQRREQDLRKRTGKPADTASDDLFNKAQ